MLYTSQHTVADILATLERMPLDRVNGSDEVVLGTTLETRKVPVCQYGALDGVPSCVAGYVLYELDREAYNVVKRVCASWSDLETTRSKPMTFVQRAFTQEANELLRAVQTSADSGYTWRESLERAGYVVSSTTTHVIYVA